MSVFSTAVVKQPAFHVTGIGAPIEAGPTRSHLLSRIAKRAFDIVGATALLVVLLPVLPALALIVGADGGPVFFRHTRIGRGGRPFGCLKYRTMVPAADQLLAAHLAANAFARAEWAERRKLAQDPRLTRIGGLLRATSLDELPQLLNVLVGEMSLVGPRPVVREELEEHYGQDGLLAYQAARPGITGLWQVSGRSDTSYPERVRLDMSYVRTWSLALDIRILLRTIPAVLARRGAV